ncbi:Uncharacterised protein [uncultured Clostridium sp.]|jgi:hypothetical protein|nr:Uncharacterised protein [uncultured Clostridium sp.]
MMKKIKNKNDKNDKNDGKIAGQTKNDLMNVR